MGVVVEHVQGSRPISTAVGVALERLRDRGVSRGALVFPVDWVPSLDIVDVIVTGLADCEDLMALSLVHPSAVMTILAAAVGLRVPGVEVTARGSLHDDPDEETTDATKSKTIFALRAGESFDAFVRRATSEARSRVVRRFALVFNRPSAPGLEIAELLAAELMNMATVREIGLIHPSASLDTFVATLRLRAPSVHVSVAAVDWGDGSSKP